MFMPNWSPQDVYDHVLAAYAPWRLPKGWVIVRSASQLRALQLTSATRVRGLINVDVCLLDPTVAMVVATMLLHHCCNFQAHITVRP